MNEYNVTSILPNIHSYLTNKKVNNYHNSAYIDSFFSYLGSNLTENGNCPTFPSIMVHLVELQKNLNMMCLKNIV